MNSPVKSEVQSATCPLCGDTGWKPVGSGPERRVARCECRLQQRGPSLEAAARIPKRYERCELSNFITEFSGEANGDHDPSLARARFLAGKFVEDYPLDNKGLLLVGPNGTGKTHLAVGVIKELMRGKGVPCLFYDYRELLKEIRRSYDSSVQTTELDVLRPVFDIEVLVLDDLGAFSTNQWERDTVSYILNKRYNDEKTTIVTTYLQDRASPVADSSDTGNSYTKSNRALEEARSAMRERTLGERIGDQMRARLHEMCRVIEIKARDYRERGKTNAAWM